MNVRELRDRDRANLITFFWMVIAFVALGVMALKSFESDQLDACRHIIESNIPGHDI